MHDIINIIIEDSYSLSSLKHKIRILKSFLSTYFFGGVREQFSPSDQIFLNSLPKAFVQKFSKDNLSQIFSQTEESLNNLSLLTIYLPFEPIDEAVKNIAVKARGLFNQNLILDIKYNPSLIAGCALAWKGIYRDYSLRSRIESQKNKILESFKTFLG